MRAGVALGEPPPHAAIVSQCHPCFQSVAGYTMTEECSRIYETLVVGQLSTLSRSGSHAFFKLAAIRDEILELIEKENQVEIQPFHVAISE